MRMVDKDYKYEELEGFEDIVLNRSTMRNELIQISIHDRNITFSRAALAALGDPDYVSCRINSERGLLLICKSAPEDPNALWVKCRCKTNSLRNMIESKQVKDAIERMSRRDLGTVNLDADGKKAASMRDAVIFDIGRARAAKKRMVGKAMMKKRAEAK